MNTTPAFEPHKITQHDEIGWVEVVKIVRAAFGLYLAPAKRLVEAYRDMYGIEYFNINDVSKLLDEIRRAQDIEYAVATFRTILPDA